MAASLRPMIFINLPIKSLDASIKFYEAIGFKQNHKFSGESAVMVSLLPDDTGVGAINVMLLTEPFFKGFLKDGREIADSKKSSQALLCIAASSREDVDTVVEAAKNAGGRPNVTNSPDMPNMHGGSFEDLDGHIWEVVWMAASGECE